MYARQEYARAAELYEAVVAADPANASGISGQAYFFLANSYDNLWNANRRNDPANRAWRICSGVRARTRNRSGDATTTLMQRAREVATLSRWRLYRKSIPRGASSGDEVVIE